MKKIKIFIITLLISNFCFSQTIDSLQKIVKNSTKLDTTKIINILKIAELYKKSNLDSTKILAEEAFQLSEKMFFNKGRGKAKFYIAYFYQKKSEPYKAINFYNEAIKFSNIADDLYNVADCYKNMGTIYYYFGNNDSSLYCFTSSLEIFKQLNDSLGIAKNYNNIGILYKQQGNYVKAVEYYFNSLEIKDKMGDKKGVQSTYNNIGNIYRDQGEYDKALEYCNKSLEIAIEIDDKAEIALSYNNIASLYYYQKDYNKSLQMQLKSLKIATEIENYITCTLSASNIADVYIAKNMLDSCFYYLNIAQDAAIKGKSLENTSNVKTGFAKYYFIKKNYTLAFKYATEAYEIALEISNLEYLRNSSEQKYLSAEKMGNKAMAYDNYKIFVQMRDSLTNKEKLTQALSKEFSYKEEKIALEQEKKEMEHQAEIKHQKLVRNSFIAGFILMILLAFVVLRSYRIKKKANLLLSAQNIEIKQQKEEIQTINDQLIDKNEELNQQKEEIQTQAEELLSKNEIIETAYNNVQLLSEIGKEITSSLDIKTIIATVYDHVNTLMDASVFAIGIYNAEKQRIEFDGAKEKGETLDFHYDDLNNENQFSVTCFNTQKEIIIQDLYKEFKKYFANMPIPTEGDIPKSLIYLPILTKNKIIGVITVQSFNANVYTEFHLNILRNIAIYTAIALENADSYRLISYKNTIIEHQNEAIRGSIRYAQTIQNAILPQNEFIDKHFENFIIFRPKDIVSGDFYWYTEIIKNEEFGIKNEKNSFNSLISNSQFLIPNSFFVAVVDCTGHGVPGAFMSMIGNTLLNEIVNSKKIYDTAEILTNLHKLIVISLRQEFSENNDGMDVCLCRIDKYTNKTIVNFTGAKRPLLVYKSNNTELETIKGNRKSIGGTQKKLNQEEFVANEIIFETEGIIYLSSDGYTDQNNVERKKFGSIKLSEMIFENKYQTMNEQGKIYNQAIVDWMQSDDQRDDITLIGIKIKL